MASVNEIKSALDDWINTIKDYSTYRGSSLPSLVGPMIGWFPARTDYHEGAIKELNVEQLNPQGPKQTR
jgi:hypothetical protein